MTKSKEEKMTDLWNAVIENDEPMELYWSD